MMSSEADDDEERLLSDSALCSYLDELRVLSDESPLFPGSSPLNVLMVGRSRSGKSTAVEVLRDAGFLAGPMSIYAQTKEPALHKLSTINLLDTPGVDEFSLLPQTQRSNQEITQSIKQSVKLHFGGTVHLVVFFVSIELGLAKSDIQLIKALHEEFVVKGKKYTKAAICVTRAENKDQTRCKEIELELAQEPFFHSLIVDKQCPVFFMGCLAKEELHFLNKPQIRMRFLKVNYLRIEFLKWLINLSKEKSPNKTFFELFQNPPPGMIELLFNLWSSITKEEKIIMKLEKPTYPVLRKTFFFTS